MIEELFAMLARWVCADNEGSEDNWEAYIDYGSALAEVAKQSPEWMQREAEIARLRERPSVKRYTFMNDVMLVEHPEGPVVKHDDMAATEGWLTRETLLIAALKEEIARLRAENNKLAAAIAPTGAYFLDPPDGGSPALHEVAERLVADWHDLRAKLADEQAKTAMQEAELKRLGYDEWADMVLKHNAEVEALNAKLAAVEADGEWVALTDRLPDPEVHARVLIYTEYHDFAGEQFFDVEAESLNECFYQDPSDQPEVCQHATHWRPRPYVVAARQQEDAKS